MNERERINSITAPEYLEERLRNALDTVPKRKKRVSSSWMIAAAALLFISLLSYNYNAFAFYGKKILGFDEVIFGTIKDLNDKGMGQSIERTVKLSDGTDFTLNGMMTDENQTILYYTLSNPKGINEESVDPLIFSKITGFFTDSMGVSGTYIINDEKTEIKGMKTFEPISPFSKKLSLHYSNGKEGMAGDQKITFPYDPNKAMQTEVKQSIKTTIKVDRGQITFKTITATPSSTVIKGTMNVKNFDRTFLGFSGIELLANGKPIQIMGGGNSSSFNGSTFDIQYDALPKELESLELVIKEFVGYQMLDKKISLFDMTEEAIPLEHGFHVWVKEVEQTSKGTEITVATEQDVMLDGVSIKSKDGEIPLKTTVGQTEDNESDGRIMKIRTLIFDANVKPEALIIKGMHYNKQYNKSIKIPVN
nr:DUF4179 domain-containing protein [Fredinandcohnia sp. SECRCQ15]